MIYMIEVTPLSSAFVKHIWKEGGAFTDKPTAEFQAKQIRGTRLYSKVKVIEIPLHDSQ